jgi:hypothetical protein
LYRGQYPVYYDKIASTCRKNNRSVGTGPDVQERLFLRKENDSKRL